MPSLISNTSTHNKVRLTAWVTPERQYQNRVYTTSDIDEPHDPDVVLPLTNYGRIDTTSDDFEALLDKLEYETVTIEYKLATTSGSTTWQKNNIPDNIYDGIFKEYDAVSEGLQTRSQLDAIGPHQSIWFKRIPGTDTVTTPNLSLFEYDVPGVETDDLMTALLWNRRVPTGTDPLYHTIVTWSVTNGVSAATATPPQTDNIQFSTDGGVTWSTTPPSDYSTVDAIQHYVPGIGWISDPTNDDTTDPVALISGDNWFGYINNHKLINLSTEELDDSYIIGFDIQVHDSWSNISEFEYRGTVEIPIKLIKSLSANDYRADHDFYTGCTYKLVMDDRNGAMSLGIADDATVSYTGYEAATLAFVTYPQGTLVSSTLATDHNDIRLSSYLGISVGDTIWMDEEQMTVTSIDPTERTITVDGVLTDYWSFGVTRGVNGTTAVAHPQHTPWRAIVNREALRYIAVTDSSFRGSSRMKLYRVKKRRG